MVCKASRLGLLDPSSGAFEELMRLDLTEQDEAIGLGPAKLDAGMSASVPDASEAGSRTGDASRPPSDAGREHKPAKPVQHGCAASTSAGGATCPYALFASLVLLGVFSRRRSSLARPRARLDRRPLVAVRRTR